MSCLPKHPKSSSEDFCPKQVIENIHEYAAEQGLSEEEALKESMEAKSKEFVETGAEVYAKA